jgi:hypothetical protein
VIIEQRRAYVYDAHNTEEIRKEKRIVHCLWAISALLFVLGIALAAFARPAADSIIIIAGRGSAGLAAAGLMLFAGLKLAESRKAR